MHLFEKIMTLNEDWYHMSRKPILMLSSKQPLYFGKKDCLENMLTKRQRGIIYKLELKSDINIFTKSEVDSLDLPDDILQKAIKNCSRFRWIKDPDNPKKTVRENLPDFEEFFDMDFSWGDNKDSTKVLDYFIRKAGYDGFFCNAGSGDLILGLLNPKKYKLKKTEDL